MANLWDFMQRIILTANNFSRFSWTQETVHQDSNNYYSKPLNLAYFLSTVVIATATGLLQAVEFLCNLQIYAYNSTTERRSQRNNVNTANYCLRSLKQETTFALVYGVFDTLQTKSLKLFTLYSACQPSLTCANANEFSLKVEAWRLTNIKLKIIINEIKRSIENNSSICNGIYKQIITS